MDVEKWKEAVKKALSKEKSTKILLVLGVCGILLIYLSTLFSSGKKQDSEPVQETVSDSAASYEKRLEQELSRIVSAITGEPDPAVMVTLKNGSRYIYAADEKGASQTEQDGTAAEERETKYVVLKNSQGAQQALPITEIQPKVKGVIIVSRYAGDPEVREKLTEAAKTVLDISSARICVTDSG